MDMAIISYLGGQGVTAESAVTEIPGVGYDSGDHCREVQQGQALRTGAHARAFCLNSEKRKRILTAHFIIGFCPTILPHLCTNCSSIGSPSLASPARRCGRLRHTGTALRLLCPRQGGQSYQQTSHGQRSPLTPAQVSKESPIFLRADCSLMESCSRRSVFLKTAALLS